jgi:hypothetical protein
MAHVRASCTLLKVVTFASRSFSPFFTIFFGFVQLSNKCLSLPIGERNLIAPRGLLAQLMELAIYPSCPCRINTKSKHHIATIVRPTTPPALLARTLHARFRVWTGPSVSAILLPLEVLLAQLMGLTACCCNCAPAHAPCSARYALNLSHHVLPPHCHHAHGGGRARPLNLAPRWEHFCPPPPPSHALGRGEMLGGGGETRVIKAGAML